jgi:hypothetical protein
MKKPPGFRRRNKIEGVFAPRLIEMLESPAYRVLSVSAHRVLSRVEIEIAHHGGHDNGALQVTYRNFEDYGIDRHAIAPAIREAEELGFVRVRHGRGGNAEYRESNRFGLTYRPVQLANPTNDWKKIETMKQALEIAHAARTSPRQKHFPVGVFTNFGVGNPHRKPNSPVGETPTTGPPEKPPLLSISRVGGSTAPAGTDGTAPRRRRRRGR